MKLALIFLSAMLAITHQQYPMELPWFSPQPIANHYQPFYYNNPSVGRYFPSRPIVYHQNYELMNQDHTEDSEPFGDENDASNSYPDVQSRFKGFKKGFKKPAIFEKNNPRLFYFGSGSTFTNPFFQTATFILTSTINVTSVQVCVPSTVFVVGATTCRRKKREIDLASMEEPGHDQFYITPTETQNVEPTMQPTDLFHDESRHIPSTHHGLTTSKQEIIVEESESDPQIRDYKQKRFLFNQYLASTTITSYSFQTTTVTKTVILAGSLSASCRPYGYINC